MLSLKRGKGKSSGWGSGKILSAYNREQKLQRDKVEGRDTSKKRYHNSVQIGRKSII
jgi:hypothetical protein